MAKKQRVRSLKFKYRKDPDWLPVCIDKEYSDVEERSDDEEENDCSVDNQSESESEVDSDEDKDVPQLMKRKGSYDSDDDSLFGEDSDSDDDPDDSGGGLADDDLDAEEVAGLLEEPEPRRVDCRVDPQEQDQEESI